MRQNIVMVWRVWLRTGFGRWSGVILRNEVGPRRRWSCCSNLTFVVAVGTAAAQFAEMLTEGHIGPAIIAFC